MRVTSRLRSADVMKDDVTVLQVFSDFTSGGSESGRKLWLTIVCRLIAGRTSCSVTTGRNQTSSGLRSSRKLTPSERSTALLIRDLSQAFSTQRLISRKTRDFLMVSDCMGRTRRWREGGRRTHWWTSRGEWGGGWTWLTRKRSNLVPCFVRFERVSFAVRFSHVPSTSVVTSHIRTLPLRHYVMLFLLFRSQATPDTMENELRNGLVIGHAYSITMATNVSGFTTFLILFCFNN